MPLLYVLGIIMCFVPIPLIGTITCFAALTIQIATTYSICIAYTLGCRKTFIGSEFTTDSVFGKINRGVVLFGIIPCKIFEALCAVVFVLVGICVIVLSAFFLNYAKQQGWVP